MGTHSHADDVDFPTFVYDISHNQFIIAESRTLHSLMSCKEHHAVPLILFNKTTSTCSVRYI